MPAGVAVVAMALRPPLRLHGERMRRIPPSSNWLVLESEYWRMSEQREFKPGDFNISLQGKDYLPVAARVKWFRTVHPNGGIETREVAVEVSFGDSHRNSTGAGGK